MAEDLVVLCQATKALISNVPRIVSNDVNACHVSVINYFPYNARDDRCALDYLRNKIFMKEIFFFRNAELKELINSQPGDNISTFSKLFNSLLTSAAATGGCLHSLLRDENLLWQQVSNAHHILRLPKEKGVDKHYRDRFGSR